MRELGRANARVYHLQYLLRRDFPHITLYKSTTPSLNLLAVRGNMALEEAFSRVGSVRESKNFGVHSTNGRITFKNVFFPPGFPPSFWF